MKYKTYSIFDIIGPKMIGPSSSHTAGAARIGKVAKRISRGKIKKVTFYLHGSFANTYRGHGTDRALIAGILGLDPNDENLGRSMELAKEQELEYQFIEADLGEVHPNTVKIVIDYKDGGKSELVGSSIGGGSIKIIQINGLDVEFTGEYPTLVIRHIDKLGIIADVTKVLSHSRINIATMNVFRHHKGEDAFMIIETDSLVSEDVENQIKLQNEDIKSVAVIEAL